MNTASASASALNLHRTGRLAAYLFYPVGVIRIWKSGRTLWLRLLYTLIGLPLFFAVTLMAGILLVAAFLPPLDLTVADRSDRTVVNRDGNYKATFLMTGNETRGAYELIRVEVEPHGGNDWHYHTKFDEYFTVLNGTATVGKNGQVRLVQQGDSAVAFKREMHYFGNPTDSPITLLVRVAPAAGLEKTVRVAYGLTNDGLFKGGITDNPWHMALMLGYSGSYLPGIPGWIQEPLVNALAKIAQWKGEDRALYKYFR